MDSTDQEILDILKDDGRASYTEVAEQVDVSEGTVRNRVEKMIEEGVIEKFTVEVNQSKEVKAFVSVNVSTSREFNEILEEFPNEVEAYELAGDIDLIVEISRETSEDINDAVDIIRGIKGVEDTRTYMVLSENKKEVENALSL
jgi:DNA-binding Lrp family transcriptional regulator